MPLDAQTKVLLVLSGKGGVGKSTVTAHVAMSLVQQGFRVGVLDIDLTGPSVPRLFALDGHAVHQSAEGWIPVYPDASQKLGVMSIGFLLAHKDDPVVWRGPKKTAMIRQFVENVHWGPIDYLLIDTPPGTSDEHIAAVESLKSYNPEGAIVVTTPQKVSLVDVKKEIAFCRAVELPILGLIENMSGFVCPTCSECTNIFSKGGGEALAVSSNIPFLGSIPLDPSLTKLVESDAPYTQRFTQSQVYPFYAKITQQLVSDIQKGI